MHSDVASKWRDEVLKNKKFSWATDVVVREKGKLESESNSTNELRRRHTKLESGERGVYKFTKYCEDMESIATKRYKLAHESWVDKVWAWVSADNDDEDKGDGEIYMFTASDFAVLCITLLIIAGGAYAVFLYMNPTRRAERGGYQII